MARRGLLETAALSILMACVYAYGRDPVAASAPKENAPGTRAENQLAARDTAPAAKAAAEELTAQEVLLKCAETYKAMKSCYEKGTVTGRKGSDVVAGLGGTYAIAYKKPIEAGPGKRGTQFSIFTKTGFGTFSVESDPAVERDPASAATQLQGVVTAMHDPFFTMRFAADPVKFVKDEVKEIGAAGQSDLAGRKVYKVEIESEDHKQTWYVDRERFLITGMDTVEPPSKQVLAGKFYEDYRADTILVDEVPKDSGGKEIGVRAFTGADKQTK